MWQCVFCRSLNDDIRKSCTSCGASKTDSIANHKEYNKSIETAALHKEIKTISNTVNEEYGNALTKTNETERNILKDLFVFLVYSFAIILFGEASVPIPMIVIRALAIGFSIVTIKLVVGVMELVMELLDI